MKKRIFLSTATTYDEELCFIKEAFDKNWVAPLGFNCDEFENEISYYLGCAENSKYHCLSLNSGTACLHLAVKLAGIKKGDVVLCSDLTFSASVNPVSYEGGIQVFVDSERDTWNMDPKALEKAFEKYPNAKAVILVHLYGTPAKVDEIAEICKRHNAVLIEDAAEALSATYNGKKCGTFGDYGVISFNGNKIITTSGGGMLITKNEDARKKAFYWATQSREPVPWYQHNEIGYNYRLSNVLAGIGRGQLLHLEDHKKLKTKIYNTYKKGFEGLPITMNPYLEGSEPNFWLSCVLIDEAANVTPMDILKKLNDYNIESRPFWKPMHMQPVFSNNDYITIGDEKVNEKIFERGLCLPSDIKMTDEEQQKVIDIIREIFS